MWTLGSTFSERLPPADYRIVRISLLDLRANRVMKLGEGFFDRWLSIDGGPSSGRYYPTSSRHFLGLDRIIDLMPSFKEKVNIAGVEGGGLATTVMLSVYINPDTGDNFQNFSSVLELWKFLEICMTGESF